MDVSHHDTSEGAAPSRPDDPAVVAAAAGKTTPERGAKAPQQHQPSERHNRGPPDDDDGGNASLVTDALLGGKAIAEYIERLLGVSVSRDDIYYAHKTRKWPIGKYGAQLIASKRNLDRHAEKIMRGDAA